MDKTRRTQTMGMLNLGLSDNLNIAPTTAGIIPTTGWNFWYENYYPNIIRESYPVYLQDKAKDTGKQAFEIIKSLQDKKLMKLDKVADFIEAMDTLIKIL